MIASIVSYALLRYNIISNHEKETQILFYKVQNETSSLLSQLLHQYSVQKEIVLKKHKEVAEYISTSKEKALDLKLETIYAQINNSDSNKPYNIYITDKNLVIKNTTFEKDKGFDLTFAKSSFDAHFEQNITGICTPLFEKSSKEFLSYTDSYISSDKENLLQVSYTYHESRARLLEIQELIASYPNIIDAKAYIILNTGFVNDIILKDFLSYKPDFTEILAQIKNAASVNDKLTDTKTNLTISNFEKDGISYTQMYLASISAIDNNTKIIYSILLDDAEFHSKLSMLNLFIIAVLSLGIVAILSTNRLRKKESRLKEQDSFIQSSMHEIKTPLSIITLNNELRELEFGRDDYSVEIESAIKTLKTSYDDMSFTITKDKLNYQVERLNLCNIVKERVDYFKTIAISKSKSISLSIQSDCKVNISRIELIRLLDNNLSNAIKYSKNESEIFVNLDKNLLTFHNVGETIKNPKIIFDKYVRENCVVGGHGLGLSIVSDISKKYEIAIALASTLKNGTTFSYKFKCHTDDISKR